MARALNPYYEKNEKTIWDSFAKLQAREYNMIRPAMTRLLRACVEYALFSHDLLSGPGHKMMHLVIGDSYGWILFHNGVAVESEVTGGHDRHEAEANITELLKRSGSGLHGWVGVVMAGMRPTKYFAMEYEVDILNMTMSFFKENYRNYFKELV